MRCCQSQILSDCFNPMVHCFEGSGHQTIMKGDIDDEEVMVKWKDLTTDIVRSDCGVVQMTYISISSTVSSFGVCQPRDGFCGYRGLPISFNLPVGIYFHL